MEKKLHGIVTALLTPLHEDGSLDVNALEGLIENQITGGVNGIFIGGLTGEGAALSEETLLRLCGTPFALFAAACHFVPVPWQAPQNVYCIWQKMLPMQERKSSAPLHLLLSVHLRMPLSNILSC